MNNYLEYQIDKLIEKIDKLGFHAHKNNPHRNHEGQYLKGEAYDYDLFLPNYKACFDAKMSEKEYYTILEKDIKQLNNLKKCKASGMDSFFLIYFKKLNKLLKFDVDIIISQLKESKRINYKLGEVWNIEELIKCSLKK